MEDVPDPRAEFERDLRKAGFRVDYDEEECLHWADEYVCWYVQESPDGFVFDKPVIREKELTWWRGSGCEECASDYIGCAFCGGMYRNFRAYRVSDAGGSKECTSRYNMRCNPLRANALIKV